MAERVMRMARRWRSSGARTSVLLALVVLAALVLRLDGLEWDDATYPHPDERYMIMVASALHSDRVAPRGASEAERAARREACRARYADDGGGDWFDSACSRFDPGNVGHPAYPYGLLPLASVRLIAESAARLLREPAYTQYGGLHVVGRTFSAVCDVLTVLATFVLGRLLWNRVVGLLAATLYAFAVLPIQSSHFFTVDAPLTLAASVSLIFLVRVARFGHRADAVAFGSAFGLALACKISIAPIALLLPVAVAGAPPRVAFAGTPDLVSRIAVRLPDVVLAALAAFVAFRIAAPNAFTGPAWYQAWPSQYFIDQALASMRLASGDVDIPPNWQWLGRTPWVFAGKNLALWGLGPALGLAALVGVAGVGVSLLRRGGRNHPRRVAWLFAVGYFALIGGQWVATMRYLLPVYPVLCVLAAGWLVTRARRWRRARRFAGSRTLARLPAVAVVGLTAVWALAFHAIPTTIHPYVAATHWIVRTIEAPVSSPLATGGGVVLVNWPAAGRFGDALPPTRAAATRAPVSGTIDRVTLHRVTREREDDDPRLAVRILDGEGRLVAEAAPSALPFRARALDATRVEVSLAHPVHLVGGSVYQLQVSVHGGTLTLSGAAIAQEGAWNDSVPMRVPWPAPGAFEADARSGAALRGIDGVDPFAQGYYVPIDLAIATEDDAAKRTRLVDALERAEWLVVPNARFFDAIGRNPLRFPLTTRFYDALFTGELGFTRVALFVSPPRFAGIVIDDQALPRIGQRVTGRPGLAMAAEEAFSVYDHPAVHVFRKDRAIPRAAIAAALDGDVASVEDAQRAIAPRGASRLTWSTREASMAPDGLLATAPHGDFGEADALDMRARGALAQFAYVLAWYALALVLALVAWPWLAALWPDLPDRGYGVARITGLLLIALPAWWLASLGVAAWSGRGLAMLFFAAVALTAPLARPLARRAAIGRSVLRVAVRLELAFLALFVVGVVARLIDPDLWAPTLGGEKPMDFALFRGVLQTDAFPPVDPWFAGGRVNYYYFGFVLAGVLAKLAGTPPAIAYNLALPLWFAMTGTAAFAITFDAAVAWRREHAPRPAWIGGAVALVAATLLGNLDLPRTLAPNVVAAAHALVSETAPSLAKVSEAFAADPVRWFWSPTRTVSERPGASYEVNEFPAFTFLFGDLHAHLLALPLQLLALCALLALALASTVRRRSPRRVFACVAALAVPVGLLRATNAWDWPLYLLLGGLGAGLAARVAAPSIIATPRVSLVTRRLAVAGAAVAVLIAAQAIVAWPFHGFVTGEVTVRAFGGARTPLLAWMAIQGWFAIIAVVFAASLVDASPRAGNRARALARILRLTAVLGVGATLVVALLVAAGITTEIPAIGVQGALVAWLGATLADRTQSPLERAALVVAIVGFGVALAPEFIVVGRDLGRMNTFFKSHMQSWILLSLASGLMIVALLDRGFARRAPRALRIVFGAVSLVAIAYVPFALVGRAHTRFASGVAWSLDGEAFLAHAVYDFDGRRLPLVDDRRLIRWLRENALATDVVLEAQLPEYRWGSRVSVFTSRPTILGYRFHETQQRPIPSLGEVIELRKGNVLALYASTDAERVLHALAHYRVRYVVVGGLERAVYPAEGLAKFEALVASGALEVAFRSGNDVIYRVSAGAGEAPRAGARF